MDKKEKDILRNHLPALVEQINPTELLPYLYCLSTNSREEIETALTSQSRSSAVQKLHNHLIRNPSGFTQLVNGLRKLDNLKLADLLDPSNTGRGGVTPYHRVDQPCNGQTRISELNVSVMNILEALDVPGTTDWQEVAGKLGYSLLGCNTLKAHAGTRPTRALLTQWSQTGNDTLEQFMKILNDIERRDVLQQLEDYTGFTLPRLPDDTAICRDDTTAVLEAPVPKSARKQLSEATSLHSTVRKGIVENQSGKASSTMVGAASMETCHMIVNDTAGYKRQESCTGQKHRTFSGEDISRTLSSESTLCSTQRQTCAINDRSAAANKNTQISHGSSLATGLPCTDSVIKSAPAPNELKSVRSSQVDNHQQNCEGHDEYQDQQRPHGVEERWRYRVADAGGDKRDVVRVEMVRQETEQPCHSSLGKLTSDQSHQQVSDMTHADEHLSMNVSSSLSSLSCPSVGDAHNVHDFRDRDGIDGVDGSAVCNVGIAYSESECSRLSLGSLNDEIVSEDELHDIISKGKKFLPSPDYDAIDGVNVECSPMLKPYGARNKYNLGEECSPDFDAIDNVNVDCSLKCSGGRPVMKTPSLGKLKMPVTSVRPEFDETESFENTLETPEVSFNNDLETPNCFGPMSMSFPFTGVIAQCTDQSDSEIPFCGKDKSDVQSIKQNVQLYESSDTETSSVFKEDGTVFPSSSVCQPKPALLSFDARSENAN